MENNAIKIQSHIPRDTDTGRGIKRSRQGVLDLGSNPWKRTHTHGGERAVFRTWGCCYWEIRGATNFLRFFISSGDLHLSESQRHKKKSSHGGGGGPVAVETTTLWLRSRATLNRHLFRYFFVAEPEPGLGWVDYSAAIRMPLAAFPLAPSSSSSWELLWLELENWKLEFETTGGRAGHVKMFAKCPGDEHKIFNRQGHSTSSFSGSRTCPTTLGPSVGDALLIICFLFFSCKYKCNNLSRHSSLHPDPCQILA